MYDVYRNTDDYNLKKNRKILVVRKNIFACLFSVHNTISLSRQWEKYLSKRSLIKHTCS